MQPIQIIEYPRRQSIWRMLGAPFMVIIGSISCFAAALAVCWCCFAIFGE